jgi:TRAP-type uncharacterized transport system fused permease subunit
MKPLVFPNNLGFPKVILSVLLLIGILDIDFYIGYPFMDEQLYFLLLMAALGCAFNILSVTLLVIGVALFFTYPYLSEFANDEVYTLRLLSWWIIPLIFMSLWKTCGKSFAIIFAMFMIYPFIVKTPTKSMDILSHIVIDNTAMLGIPMHIICGIVFIFVAIGQLLVHIGLIDILINYITRYIKSPARVAIMSSAVFGSVSGSAVSNVMSTGQLTIPLMIKCGYSKVKASAYEAVASTGGQLLPPIMGAAAFLMAEILQVSYWEVVKVAILPSLLFYSILLLTVPKTDNITPGQDFNNKKHFSLKKMVLDIGDIMYELIILAAAVGLIIGILDQTGLSFHISTYLISLSNGSIPILLLLTAILCIVLGMGMPTTSTYLIVAIICAPALIEVGITEIYAHLFVLYYGVLSMITPPVALASFSAAKLSGANPLSVAFQSVYIGWPLFLIPFFFVMM